MKSGECHPKIELSPPYRNGVHTTTQDFFGILLKTALVSRKNIF
jgi:hypothetical protein